MLRALLAVPVLAAAICLKTVALAQPIEAPQRQAAFETMLEDVSRRSRDAANDAARVALRQEVTRRINADGAATATGWVGNVAAVRADSAGNVTVVINLLRGTALVTNLGDRDGRRIGHPIFPNSPLIDTVGRLRPGQMVRFDGTFYCARRDGRPTLDCPLNFQPTHEGALDRPILLIDFRRIAPL
ncbi:MAG: hypothetical protein K2X84_00825, partial [Beijerinckiaceae bacterium]|nr:hypothetical protein [Beijerinckiaceae bacterium]